MHCQKITILCDDYNPNLEKAKDDKNGKNELQTLFELLYNVKIQKCKDFVLTNIEKLFIVLYIQCLLYH